MSKAASKAASKAEQGPTLLRSLSRGALRHCPRCGKGKLFVSWFTMKERCPHCGYRFQRYEGFMLGSVTMNIVVTFGLLLLAIVIGFIVSYPDIAVVPILIAGFAIAVLVPVLFLPFSRTIWAAVELAMRPLTSAECEEAAAYAAPSSAGSADGSRLQR